MVLVNPRGAFKVIFITMTLVDFSRFFKTRILSKLFSTRNIFVANGDWAMSHVVGEGTKNISPSQTSVMLTTKYESLDDDTFPCMYFDRKYNHSIQINVDN